MSSDIQNTATAENGLRSLRKPGGILLIAEILILILINPAVQGFTPIAAAGKFLTGLIQSAQWSANIWNWFTNLPVLVWTVLACAPPAVLLLGLAGPMVAGALGSSSRVAAWPTGLAPEVAEQANKRLSELLDNTPDAFPEEPGVRIQIISVGKESTILPGRQDYIVPWNVDGEIFIDGLVEGRIHLVMDRGTAKLDSKDGLIPMRRDIPIAVIRKNRADDVIAKCYITWLGGK